MLVMDFRARVTDLIAAVGASGLATGLVDSRRKVANSGTQVFSSDITPFVAVSDSATSASAVSESATA